jgi:hypothetical protein
MARQADLVYPLHNTTLPVWTPEGQFDADLLVFLKA